MTSFRAGFTGRIDGLTPAQTKAVTELLRAARPTHLLHGDCIGADAQAHAIGRLLRLTVEGFPSTRDEFRAHSVFDVEHEADDPEPRNRAIVDHCDVLYACPPSEEEWPRSGTWQTVRYARDVGRMVAVVSPDGAVAVEVPGVRAA